MQHGCLKSIIVYVISISIITVLGIILAIWREHNPLVYCDQLDQNNIETYNPTACRLRYPILNTEETKKLITENEELKDKNNELQNQLGDLRDVLENGKTDNWEPDVPQINF